MVKKFLASNHLNKSLKSKRFKNEQQKVGNRKQFLII